MKLEQEMSKKIKNLRERKNHLDETNRTLLKDCQNLLDEAWTPYHKDQIKHLIKEVFIE